MARPGTAVFAVFVVAAYTAALLALPQAASAMVIRMDLSDLARSADSVVIARVSSRSSRAVGPMAWRTRGIVSDSRIRVQRVLKGARSLDVTVTQPGGHVGDKTLVVSDLAEFHPGDRAVLFLNAQGGVVGGYQGKLDIVGDQVPGIGLSLAEVIRRVRADNGLPALSSREIAALSLPATAAAGVAAPSVSALTIGVTVSSITPGALNSGIGDRVLITGTGFGAADGTVTFPDGRGLSPDESIIVLWTDSAIVCEIPQFAESGAVVVTRAGTSTSGSSLYRTGFSTDGSRWADPAVSYRINENSPDLTGEGAAIQRAFATWNADGSRFRFSYSGTNSSTVALPPADGFNDIYFASSGFGDPNIVAWNQIWLDGTGIIESDVIFNDETRPFSDGAVSGRIDVETVALHELGHTLSIDDQYGDNIYNEVMGAAVIGEARRVLSQAEIDGALYLYDGPTRPVVTSSSHPLETAWYAATTASLSFASSAPAPATAAGYSYVVDASPVTIPDTSAEGPVTSYSASGLTEGVQWFHVRAVTSGGVWGPTAHFQLNIATTGGGAESTALSLSAPATVKYAATAMLSGRLSAQVSNSPLAGVNVSLEAMPYGSVAFTPVASTNIDASGDYTFAVRPTVRTSYRVVFAGDARFLQSQSVERTVLPAAWVSRPFAPASVSRARSYAVYGYLKPKHTSGTSVVRVYRWRWNGRRWVSYGYVYARASATAAYPSYTKYSAALRFPYAGKWRVGAYHADAAHAATWATGFDYVTSK